MLPVRLRGSREEIRLLWSADKAWRPGRYAWDVGGGVASTAVRKALARRRRRRAFAWGSCIPVGHVGDDFARSTRKRGQSSPAAFGIVVGAWIELRDVLDRTVP